MARVKFPHDEEHFVPWIGRLVQPGEVVEIPDTDLASYVEAGWVPEGKAKQGGKPRTSEEQG